MYCFGMKQIEFKNSSFIIPNLEYYAFIIKFVRHTGGFFSELCYNRACMI
jgi:hypothetical protein